MGEHVYADEEVDVETCFGVVHVIDKVLWPCNCGGETQECCEESDMECAPPWQCVDGKCSVCGEAGTACCHEHTCLNGFTCLEEQCHACGEVRVG